MPSHPGARPVCESERDVRGQGLYLRAVRSAEVLRKPTCCAKPTCCEKPACCAKPTCCAKPACCEPTCRERVKHCFRACVTEKGCCAPACCEKPKCCEKACKATCEPTCEKVCQPKCHKLYRRPLVELLENMFGPFERCHEGCEVACGCDGAPVKAKAPTTAPKAGEKPAPLPVAPKADQSASNTTRGIYQASRSVVAN